MKILRSISMFLLVPLLVASFYWEGEIPLSSTGFALAQTLIVVIIGWMALWLVQVDEIERLREISRSYHENAWHYSSEREGTWKIVNELPELTSEGYGEGDHRKFAIDETVIPIKSMDREDHRNNGSLSAVKIVRR